MIPVIIGANGTISKSLRKYLSYILGKHEIKKLQNADILDTAHILRKVRMCKYKTYFTCEITLNVAKLSVENSYNTIHPTNMVCLWCIIVNTLHNGVNKYTNNSVTSKID